MIANVLTEATISLVTSDGVAVEVYELDHSQLNDEQLSLWADHLRRHYIADDEIDDAREGTSLSRSDFVKKYKLPSASANLGRGTRSGDFGEILVADLFTDLKYWVPRGKFLRKEVPDESTKGSDVLAIKLANQSSQSPDDELVCIECKCHLTKTLKTAIEAAIKDSAKDNLRLAYALQATKQRMLDQRNDEGVKNIRRFQNQTERPFKLKFGVAAISKATPFPTQNDLPAAADRRFILISGNELLDLVNKLYERAGQNA